MNAPTPIAQTFAVADIAHAMGLHRTNVLRRAEKEGWPFEERTGRGGTKRLYPLNQLPADVRKAVQSKVMDKVLQDAGSFLPATAGGVLPLASPAVPFSLLSDAQRLERDARNGVRLAIERLQAEAKCSLEAAIVTLLTNAGSGRLDSTLDAMLRLAKDKRGRKSDSPYPSARTLQRWLAAQDLTPKVPVKDMSVPEWAPAFLSYYQRPQKPSVAEAYKDFCKEVKRDDLPSIHQVRRFLDKMGAVTRERGRMGDRELKNIQPFVRRAFDKLLPNDVWTADGHCFDAEVQHPYHGRPFRPEVTSIADVGTRRIVGYSIGLAEGALVVVEALADAGRSNGLPAIFYVDNGSGYDNDLIKDEGVGLKGRLGFQVCHSLPYNSQARGVIERLHKTVWVSAAQKLESYMGAKMDREAKLAIFKITRKAIKNGGAIPLIGWADFIAFCNERIAEYNDHPHRSLPKITDAAGKRRHMSPNEMLAQHRAAGWEPLMLNGDEAETLYRPRVTRVAQRGEIAFGGYRYFSRDLTEFHGDTVQVAYDIHNAQWVWVYDEDGRLICKAEWNANSADYFPMSQVEQARERRADARLQRLDAKREEIELERRGRPALEQAESIVIPGLGTIDRAAIESVSVRIEEPVSALPPDLAAFVARRNATQPAPVTEPAQEQPIEPAPEPAVAQLRKCRTQFPPETNYREWKSLEAAVLEGKAIEDAADARWFVTYPQTAQFRAMQKRFEPERANASAQGVPAR